VSKTRGITGLISPLTIDHLKNPKEYFEEFLMKKKKDLIIKQITRKLIADKSVKNHLLKDFKNISKKFNEYENDDENLSECSLFLIDTSAYDMKEIYFDDENSRGNEGKVELVNIHINELIENYSVSIDQIGEAGFLSDSRRINVAIKRARRHLCIICNVQILTHDPFIKRLIDYMIQHGQIHLAFEFIDGFYYFFYLYLKVSF
ncbi:unnamed protein product, partial [Rotaria sp. Silwood2]